MKAYDLLHSAKEFFLKDNYKITNILIEIEKNEINQEILNKKKRNY